MSVFIGSKLEAQPLQRCFPLPEVRAVWSWRPNQTPLSARSSFLLGQWLIFLHLTRQQSYTMYRRSITGKLSKKKKD